MRICLLYDRLYPHTLGGAEVWYRNLAERLAEQGHEVTYVTLRHWERGVRPSVRGVRVVSVGRRMEVYVAGRRRIVPPIVYGVGVLRHLLRHGREYDVVHTASFPYFSVLAVGLLRGRSRYRIVIDWFEVWTRGYWREYLGPAAGTLGWLIQLACVRLPQRAFCFSRLHRSRLEDEGFRGEVTVLGGLIDAPVERPTPQPAEPLVVFAGRHVPEKRVTALVPAFAAAREAIPELRCEIYGDGPEREAVEQEVTRHGLDGAVQVRGFVGEDEVDRALRRALCMVLPSSREGYGLVVVEAAARGTPSVVVRGEDNAATELVDPGENGYVAESASAEDLAAAIRSVHAAGPALRESTAAWFERNADRLSLRSSLAVVARRYES